MSTSAALSVMRPRVIVRPGNKFWSKSGFGPDPESMTATITPEPVVVGQTSLTFDACKAH